MDDSDFQTLLNRNPAEIEAIWVHIKLIWMKIENNAPSTLNRSRYRLIVGRWLASSKPLVSKVTQYMGLAGAISYGLAGKTAFLPLVLLHLAQYPVHDTHRL